jgi:hypothetical protein
MIVRGNQILRWEVGEGAPSEVAASQAIAHTGQNLQCRFQNGRYIDGCDFNLNSNQLILMLVTDNADNSSIFFSLKRKLGEPLTRGFDYDGGQTVSSGAVISNGTCQRTN